MGRPTAARTGQGWRERAPPVATFAASGGHSGPADAAFTELILSFFDGTAVEGIRPDKSWLDIEGRATGYRRFAPGNVQPDGFNDVSWKLPGGGLTSTTRQAAAYCALLLDDSEPLIGAEARARMWTPNPTSGYGYAFSIDTPGGNLRAQHSGRQEGGTAHLMIYPGDDSDPSATPDLCFVALSNTTFRSAEQATAGFALRNLLEGIESVVRSRLAAGQPAIVQGP